MTSQINLTVDTQTAPPVNTVEVLVPADPFLTFHADQIKQLCKKTRENIVAIGQHLKACRDHLDHGDWLPWLERQFGWSDRTALNYMRVYELNKSENFSDLALPVSSLYLLAAPSTAEEARAEVVQRVSSGEALGHAGVKEIVSRHNATAEDDCRPRRKDGRIDHRLESFQVTSVLQTAAIAGADAVKFPPNLTAEMAAEAIKDIDEAIEEFRKLRARLVAYVPERGRAKKNPPLDPEALLKNWARLAAPELRDRIRQIQAIAGTGRHLKEGGWRVVDRMRARAAKLEAAQ